MIYFPIKMGKEQISEQQGGTPESNSSNIGMITKESLAVQGTTVPFMFFPRVGFGFGINRTEILNSVQTRIAIENLFSGGMGEHGIDYDIITKVTGMDRRTASRFAQEHGHGYFANLTSRYRSSHSFRPSRTDNKIKDIDIERYFDRFAVRGTKDSAGYTFHKDRNPQNFVGELQLQIAILHLLYDGLADNNKLRIVDFSKYRTETFNSFVEYADEIEKTGFLSDVGSTAYFDLADDIEANRFAARLLKNVQILKSST